MNGYTYLSFSFYIILITIFIYIIHILLLCAYLFEIYNIHWLSSEKCDWMLHCVYTYRKRLVKVYVCANARIYIYVHILNVVVPVNAITFMYTHIIYVYESVCVCVYACVYNGVFPLQSEKSLAWDAIHDELIEKIRKLEEDRQNVDLSWAGGAPGGGRARARRKAVTVTGPYIVYMLDEQEIMEDWTAIKKALKRTIA